MRTPVLIATTLCLALTGCFSEFPAGADPLDGGGPAADGGGDGSLVDRGVPADEGGSPDTMARFDGPPDGGRDPSLDRGVDVGLGSDGAQTPPDLGAQDGSQLDARSPADALPDGPRADACTPAPESCNGVDDDCDDQVDEATAMGPCMVGVGVCARPGEWACEGERWACQGVAGPRGGDEVCNGLDDDCDGMVDEPGERCTINQGACQILGAMTCVGPDERACRSDTPEAPLPQVERCNAIDDDCDGRIDEDTCVDYTVRNCELLIGWADRNGAPGMPAEDWTGCPDGPPQRAGDARCASTGGDRTFHHLPVGGDVGSDDVLGFAWRCSGPNPSVDEWLETSCRAQVLHSDGRSPDGLLGQPDIACPPFVPEGPNPNPRCVSTSGDGLYHPMWLRGDVDYNDVFGVAWACVSAERPRLAAQLTAQVIVTLAWQFREEQNLGCGAERLIEGADRWEDCPTRGVDASGPMRCASSSGDGSFHAFEIGGGFEQRDVRECSAFGVALQVLNDQGREQDGEEDE